MGQHITLTAKDGFKLDAYRADPSGKPRGGIVVIQEIFGVNHHIRSVTDRYAQLGYLAIAPALFDRVEKGFIRAETISFADFVAFGGEQGAKEAGKMRLEGADYVVQDGDIFHFRFNV